MLYNGNATKIGQKCALVLHTEGDVEYEGGSRYQTKKGHALINMNGCDRL